MTSSNDPDEIRRQIDATRNDLAGNVDLLEEKVSPSKIVDRRVGAAKSAFGSARDSVMGKVHSGSDSASGAADSAKSALSSAGDAVTSAPSTVTSQAQGNPMAAGVIAFGVGWLLGSILSPSRQERQLAAQVKDQAQPALTESAQHIADEVREPAQQAVAAVKDTATQAGQELGEDAKSHAADVKGQAQDAASDVKGHATA